MRAAAQVAKAWGMLEEFGDAKARVGIMGWGSTIGPVKEAVDRAKEAGIPVAVMYTKMIFPLPRDEMAEFIAQRDLIIVPELNFTGQFARMIQAEFWRKVISVTKYGGQPFLTHEIYAEIEKAYQQLAAAAPKTAKKKSIKKPAAKKAVAKKPVKKTAPKKSARRK